MRLTEFLARSGGAARTAAVHAEGFKEHAIRKHVQEGKVIRPRVGWLALASIKPHLKTAIEHGVVLTCATAAALQKLWVLDTSKLHVAVRSSGHHVTLKHATVHWRKPLKPRQPDLLVDHLENMLDCVATCLPHAEALAIWDSALQKKLVDHAALSTLPLRGNAKLLFKECTPFSDSGLESMFRARLRWLRVPIRPQAWVHGHRVDFLIGDRLVVQIDGKQHEGAQRASDRAHDTELITRGYYVVRVGYAEIVHSWHEIETKILDLLARGQHLAR